MGREPTARPSFVPVTVAKLGLARQRRRTVNPYHRLRRLFSPAASKEARQVMHAARYVNFMRKDRGGIPPFEVHRSGRVFAPDGHEITTLEGLAAYARSYTGEVRK